MNIIVPMLLLGAIVFSLWANIQTLYTFPTPNSWVYWDGDETQAMAESHSQVTTLLYAYPNAVGSIFQHGSGILKGSVWFSSLLYGGAMILIHSNPVDVGRTVSFILGCMMLIVVYSILRDANTSHIISLAAVLALSSTDCFLIMSHTARPDMLISLTDIFIIATLIRYRVKFQESPFRVGMNIGLLIFAGLLVSIHVWIDCVFSILFLLWVNGILKRWETMTTIAMVLSVCFGLVSIIYYYKTSRFDLFGPFGYLPTPMQHLFSPGAQKGNLLYRWFIAEEWSPGYIIIGIPIFAIMLILFLRGNHVPSTTQRWVGATILLASSIAYLEAILPRYYIYVLPAITVCLGLMAQSVWNSIGNRTLQRGFGAAMLVGIFIFAWRFNSISYQRAVSSIEIAAANKLAVSSAIEAINHDHSAKKNVIAPSPALYILGDDTNIIPISELFLTTPDSARRFDAIPKADYLITLNSPRVVDVGGNDRKLLPLLRGHWKFMMERTGNLSDIGGGSVGSKLLGEDTLRLYKITP